MLLGFKNIKLGILLPQSPKCWDYRCAPPHMAQKAIVFLIKSMYKDTG
jgi:hypothetical protein